ncbi:MAG: TerD family protein, partial [Actinomycetota bacterium]|nr:TerD family protein [Actinomycetota bacterium]
ADTGGAFGHIQPSPAATTPPPIAPPPAVPPPAPAPPPAGPPAAGYPPPPTAAPQGFPPQGQPAGYPPPSAGYPPPSAGYPPPSAGTAAGFPPPSGAPVSAEEAGLSAQRPVSLQKGQRVSLRKESGGDLTIVRMGLGWDPIQKKKGMFGSREVEIDLDASAVMFADRQLIDVAFYNNLRSKDGAVQHQGDNRTGAGEGDDETMQIDLTRVSAHITSIVFIVTSYEGQTFEQVQNAFCRLIDHASGAELARYTLSGGAAFTGMVMAKVYRDGSGWKMQAIGEGIQAKTPSEAFPQLSKFL